MTNFILASPDACIGCRTCEVACALAHAVESEGFHPRLKVMRLDHVSIPVMCHQCENAPCISACPTEVLTMGSERVEAYASNCIGCQECVVACPFGAIAVVDSANCSPIVVKCDLCTGWAQEPACINVCPTAALSLMTAETLSALQNERKCASARRQPDSLAGH